ncbi:ATP-binding protein [Bradyrhizobium sp. CB1650]|uniref:ATP-binding protein n=1 Tax=Bradyrhizobium sp. CB1650 TaxID=3039153 RepID=UPI00243519CD|nr:ATP-binding protein [Bradyrhizobium sp. CB1650]WGD55155.1 ATP-binding protein [Bradyrhizobium sp. CB1650]
MTEPAHSQNIASLLEAAIPAAPLESILCTDELLKRPRRPPDHERENSALAALVSALADSPRMILQTLADKILEVLDADSAGLSLLTKDGNRFYWAAIAGAWRPHLGGGTPRDFGPCGDVLDSNTTMLFSHWERRYPYLSAATPLAEEGLLVPFFVNGKAVGTIWVIAHHNHRKFDAEDQRLLESMGRFASAAYQTVECIEELKSEVAAREKAEAELRELTHSLERQVRARTKELERRNQALAKARLELGHVIRATSLGVLTASIAHEVNQPLGAIATNGESSLRWLTKDEPDIEKVRVLTKRVVADARRASEIIGRIRDMTSRQAPEQQLLSINDVINESLSFLNHELEEKGIIVSLDLPRELPQIVGNRTQLQQVIVNLIVNAVHAVTQCELADRRISVRTILSDPETVHCSIEDSGPGIDPEHLPRIFDTFFTTKNTGMGMGLAICQSILEAHGGSIRASNDSALGGACFSFDLLTRRVQ